MFSQVLKTHDNRLQSLRGLAALTVALGHTSLLIIGLFNGVMSAIFQQNAAVILFYVLSGFVLAESLRRHKIDFGAFVLRRAFRLLPVFLTSIIAGVFWARFISHRPIEGASVWFNHFLAIQTDAHTIIENMLSMAPTARSINSSLWSIQVEIWVIPVLPLMVLVCDRLTFAQNALIWTALGLLGIYITGPATQSHPGILALKYYWCFYTGIILPQLLQSATFRRLADGTVISVELVLLVVLQFAKFKGLVIGAGELVLDSIVSAQIIAWLTISKGRSSQIFNTPALVWLGDISYSFYAYSQMIIGLVAFLIITHSASNWWVRYPIVFTLATCFLALSLSLSVGAFSFWCIEVPGMKLGRRLLGKSRGNDLILPGPH